MAFDLDTVFGYYTVKYAHIRDRRLGFIQKGLMIAILIKICAMTIVYQCGHLLEVPVVGSARANAQQPTQNGCNPMHPDCMSDFTPLTKLPYCSQYKGRRLKGDPEEDGKGKEETMTADDLEKLVTKTKQGSCVYWDAPAMTRGRSPVPGTLFMPTRVKETRQKTGCKPSKANGFKCDTKPWVRDPKPSGGGETVTEYTIADVERFTVLINQAFSADGPGVSMSGRAADFEGFAKGRPDLQDFYTKRKGFVERLEEQAKGSLKHVAKVHEIPEKPDHKGDFKNIFSLSNGDVFEVSDILRMADLRGASLLDEVREDGHTMREEGGVISIEITYSNDKKFDVFGKTPPIYTITAKFIPMKYYKIAYETLLSEDERIMHSVHGLLFLINVKGHVRTFTLANLLTVLTTAMVSLAMASTLTDYIMSYAPCLGLKDHYNTLKYQPTMDFSDLEDRISALKEQCKAKKEPYNPANVKASACSATINKYAAERRHIEHDDMLALICMFEQRLNRLDGMDVSNDDDACAKLVKDYKTKFRQEDGLVKAAPPPA